MSNNKRLTWDDLNNEEREFISMFHDLTGEQQTAFLELVRTLDKRADSGTGNHNQSGRR